VTEIKKGNYKLNNYKTHALIELSVYKHQLCAF